MFYKLPPYFSISNSRQEIKKVRRFPMNRNGQFSVKLTIQLEGNMAGHIVNIFKCIYTLFTFRVVFI